MDQSAAQATPIFNTSTSLSAGNQPTINNPSTAIRAGSHLTTRTFITIALPLMLLVLAIPVTIYLVQQSQDIRPRAAAPAPVIDPKDPEALKQALQSTQAQLYGLVCAYSGAHPAGTIMAYSLNNKELLTFPLKQDTFTYGITVSPGKYTLFFKPDDTALPLYGYTKHGLCALGEFPCGDHTLLIEEVQQGDKIGQINLCDPQYPDQGLPAQLKR